jgi:hypothetical protein
MRSRFYLAKPSQGSCPSAEHIELKRFFLRVKAKKGSNVAVVALARKVLCILHHLLINKEMYKEDGINKKVKIDVGKEFPQQEMNLEE